MFTYGAAGGIIRIGNNLDTDYGPPRIRPASLGHGLGRCDPPKVQHSAGLFPSPVSRAGRWRSNIFLDGNSFANSRSVKRSRWSATDRRVEMFWKDDVRIDLGLLSRTKEFYGQQGQDSYAGFRFTFRL